MYSLMVLLALLSMYFLTRFLQGNTVAISVGYVVSTTLLLYTHVYGVFIIIAQNVYLLTLLFLSPRTRISSVSPLLFHMPRSRACSRKSPTNQNKCLLRR
jgi:uncharacterized membrane protein